jgi:hypothetical protein
VLYRLLAIAILEILNTKYIAKATDLIGGAGLVSS